MNSNKKNTSAPASASANANVKSERTGQPYVRIVEQPRSRGLRFRYQCECRRSGSIEGANSSRSKKTYPTIEIVSSEGPFFVVVSCVTKDPPYRPHPHSIVGKGAEFSSGLCYMKVPAGQTLIDFPRMTIQCVKKNDVMSALEERRLLKVDPFMTGYPDSVKSIDLSCLRLCFQVFLKRQKEGKFNVALNPVVSQPIYDKKSSVEFEILWISHTSARVDGGKVITILCEKVVKDDIQVIFFREESGWEATAELTVPYVHKQVAVVLKSPPYSDQHITDPVQAQVMLRRPSNGATSVPVLFDLLPLETAGRELKRAKRLRECTTPRSLVDQHTQVKSHQAPLQLPENAHGGSTSAGRNFSDAASSAAEKDRLARTEQTVKVEESNLPSAQSEFLNRDDFQIRPPVPQTPFEFKQILDKYIYSDHSQQIFPS